MRNLRLPLAVALTALLLPAAASAADSARWWATFEAKQTIDWSLPKSYGTSDCFKRFWGSGSGAETWSIKTRRPVKLLAYRFNASTPVNFKYGTWDELAEGGDGLEAGGLIVRRGIESAGVDAGDCGGRAEVFPPEQTDCGSRLPAYDVTFGLSRGRLVPSPNETGDPVSWSTCPLHAPGRFALDHFNRPPATVSVAALLSGRRALTVRRTQTDSDYDPARTGSARRVRSGEVTWTLTLTPADAPRRAASRGRRGGRR